MRLNRPCLINNKTKKSPAFKNWRFKTPPSFIRDILSGERKNATKDDVSPYQYLIDKIGNQSVSVYRDVSDPHISYGNPAYNSFDPNIKVKMTYKDFIRDLNDQIQGVVLRDSSIAEILKDDLPKFPYQEYFNDEYEVEFE